MSDNAILLAEMTRIARLAGEAIMDVYESDDFDVEVKSDNSPLTRADKAAHDVIARELSKMSEYDIVSEEGDNRSPQTEAFWLVDPLDGTKEFVKRNGEFTVNIALVKAGKPALGVVYAPVTDIYYCGDVAAGQAYKIAGDEKTAIAAQSSGEVPKIVVSRSHKDERTQALLDFIGEHEEVPMGSSLKLCLVAEGAAELYPRLGPTSLWDTAAADAVVTAAGGTVHNEQGDPLEYAPGVNIKNPYFIVATKNCRIDWKKLLA